MIDNIYKIDLHLFNKKTRPLTNCPNNRQWPCKTAVQNQSHYTINGVVYTKDEKPDSL